MFCCSNNDYKINPAVFGSWMKILKSVDQSVVWLSDVGEIAKSNLRKEAKGRGVDPRLMVRPARSRELERGESRLIPRFGRPDPQGGVSMDVRGRCRNF